jgi:hypothetical protein
VQDHDRPKLEKIEEFPFPHAQNFAHFPSVLLLSLRPSESGHHITFLRFPNSAPTLTFKPLKSHCLMPTSLPPLHLSSFGIKLSTSETRVWPANCTFRG